VHVDANMVHGGPLPFCGVDRGSSCGAMYATTSSGKPASFILSTLVLFYLFVELKARQARRKLSSEMRQSVSDICESPS